METVIGIENLKDKFRLAKLKCGDLRGLKNSFALTEKFGLPALQTFYFKAGGNGDERMELVADCYGNEKQGDIYAYNMGDLVNDIKKEIGEFEVHLTCLKWNKERTDADRKDVLVFNYKNQ